MAVAFSISTNQLEELSRPSGWPMTRWTSTPVNNWEWEQQLQSSQSPMISATCKMIANLCLCQWVTSILTLHMFSQDSLAPQRIRNLSTSPTKSRAVNCLQTRRKYNAKRMPMVPYIVSSLTKWYPTELKTWRYRRRSSKTTWRPPSESQQGSGHMLVNYTKIIPIRRK